MQSLKLKFKKEGSPKCKEDQATCNETGKSIVHVTNEELNSSEMVFFCIPKAESSVKFVPKKKLKVDVKENVIQKQIGIINKKNSEIFNLDNSNLIMFERSNEINTEGLSYDNDVLNEIKTETNLITPTVTIDNVHEIDSIFEQHEILKKNEMGLTSQSSVIKNDFPIHGDSSNDMHQNNLNEFNKHIIKNKFIEDNKKHFVDQNTSTKLSNDCYFSSTTTSINYINKYINNIFDKNIGTQIKVLKNSQECYGDINEQDNDESVTTNLNESLLDKNIVIKSEFINNLTEQCVDEKKQDNNEIVKASLNDSLFEKNIVIKREFIENLTELSVDDKKQDNYGTVETNLNDSLLEKNIVIKNEVVENLPECYADGRKQDNNETEKQQINKWTIDEDKIILQTCKRVEDIEVLLETINRRIPQRSVSEVRHLYKL